MTANFLVLQYQTTIPAMDWNHHFKANPEDLDRIVKSKARRALADEMLEKGLVQFTITEPDAEDNPLNDQCAIIRSAVCVGVKQSETAQYAFQLAEAEARGFAKALRLLRERLAVLNFGDDRAGHAASLILDGEARRVQQNYDHRPDADWRPMSSYERDDRVEYLYADGSIGRDFRKIKPIIEPFDITADIGADATHRIETLEAIAWRHAGRPKAVAA